MAIANIETRNLTAAVVDSWKPVLANAISEWAKQRVLSSVLATQTRPTQQEEPVGQAGAAKVETTQEELDAFATVQRLLGSERPIEYEDTATYFKMHLSARRTWVMCRFNGGRRRSSLWVPLALERVTTMVPPGLNVTSPQAGWSCIALDSIADLERLADVFRAAWDDVKASRGKPTDAGGKGEGASSS
jgi:hypothetical protein